MGAPFRVAYPRCQVRLTAGYNPVDGPNPIIWQAVGFEDGPTPLWDPLNPTVLTPDRDGLWGVWLTINTSTSAAATIRLANIQRNGATFCRFRQPATTEGANMSIAGIDMLTAGDAITVNAQCDGANLLVNTHLTLARLGPVRWTG